MKKIYCVILFLFTFTLNLTAQNDSIIRVTKYNTLDYQKGIILKFVDKKRENILHSLTTSRAGLENYIRTFYNEGGNTYFLVIEPPTYVAITRTMIEYSDLVDVNNAFERFFNEVDSDCALDPEYLA